MRPESRRVRLQEAIERAAHLLPSQGPITVFVHHNTLHALEHLPFDEAVKKASSLFGCHPYLTEDRYRQELQRGRIRFSKLRQILAEDLGPRATDNIVGLGKRLELRLAMLQYPFRTGPTEELIWFVAEKDALRRVREEASSVARARLIAETRRWAIRDLRGGDIAFHGKSPIANGFAEDSLFSESVIESWTESEWEAFTLRALWRICYDGCAGVPTFAAAPTFIRHRDGLLEATGADSDLLVHDVLIRFSAAFLDQGLARWQLPGRDRGFLQSFSAIYRQPCGSPAPWLHGLAAELRHLDACALTALESIGGSLENLGVAEAEEDDFITATLLALRGWAGMIRQIELRGDRVVHAIPEGSLVEFLAIRLLLDQLALAYTAREQLGYHGPLSSLRDELRRVIGKLQPPSVEQRAFLVFQLAQVMGWTPEELHRLGQRDWSVVLQEIEGFTELKRRRIFHLAYERRFYTQALDAVSLHARKTAPRSSPPTLQAIFCIDEREESLRRHLEELDPHVETYGTAGFFNVPMYYRGTADAHFAPYCPAVIRPRHWVVEKVAGQVNADSRRTWIQRTLGMASHRLHLGSRAFALGALLSAVFGPLATVPLMARTFFPRLTARIRKRFGRAVHATPLTMLQLERSEVEAGTKNGHVGFTCEEMIDIGERVLDDVGLKDRLSRLVLVIGHGSTSMNNPHESAHDCGACGGTRGGPNARALAQILNNLRVRQGLKTRGLSLPNNTVFVGGYHNSSTDAIEFFDQDELPRSHRPEFESAQALFDKACERNAHERSRRFFSAPLTLSLSGALQHVEGRAEDLAQVRPEWGHATNALSIIGRRERTRGLFLDRRAFLISYDPEQDGDEGRILTRILEAVLPVCAGINLEYYFSYVDNGGWGCGTKLPHNITALLGVMDGAMSDLRTGLPWQMVEIHEPVRLLSIIETAPETMLGIMDRKPMIGRLCRNGWIQLAVLHPHTRELQLFHHGGFRPYQPQARRLPAAASSLAWYRGWREHLEFAEITA